MGLSHIIGMWVLFVIAIIVLVAPYILRSLLRRFLSTTEDPNVNPLEEVRLAKRKSLIADELLARTWKGKQNATEEDQMERGEKAAGKDQDTNVPQKDISKTKSQDEEEPLECAICLSEFEKDQIVCNSNNRACRHTFHFRCAEEWLLKHDGCPICRETYLLETRKDLKF